MTLVTLNQVIKYDVKKPYHLRIDQQEFIVVQGENGCGKSTLLKLIAGLIKPNQGKVMHFVKSIAYLPEQCHLPFFMNGMTYLKLQQYMKKTEITPNLLHLFNIPLFRDVQKLSKGNQQKLALTATLIGKPQFIVLDEPLSGLDAESQEVLLQYLSCLNQDGSTIVVSSHQHARFKHIASKVISL